MSLRFKKLIHKPPEFVVVTPRVVMRMQKSCNLWAWPLG